MSKSCIVLQFGVRQDLHRPMAAGTGPEPMDAAAVVPPEENKPFSSPAHHTYANCYGLPYQDHNYGAPPPPTPPASPPPPPAPQPKLNGHIDIEDISVTTEVTTSLPPPSSVSGDTLVNPVDPVVDDSVTRCVCEFEHDDGYMICCDKCSVWQHVDCMGVDRLNIPDNYLCERCEPRHIDKERAIQIQTRKIEEIRGMQLMQALDTSATESENETKQMGLFTKQKTKQKRKKKERDKNLKTKNQKNNLNKKPKKGKKEKKDKEKKKEKILSPQSRKKPQSVTTKKTPNRTTKSTKTSATSLIVNENANDSWHVAEAEDGFQEAKTNEYSVKVQCILASHKLNGNLEDSPMPNKQLLAQLCRVANFPNNHKGLEATESVSANRCLCEYVGKVMLRDQYDKENNFYDKMQSTVLFYSKFNGLDICIDATSYGNDGRYIRRSCVPNAEVRHAIKNSHMQFYIYSSKAITEGAEITIPFDFTYQLCNYKVECACSRANCIVGKFFKNEDLHHRKLEEAQQVTPPPPPNRGKKRRTKSGPTEPKSGDELGPVSASVSPVSGPVSKRRKTAPPEATATKTVPSPVKTSPVKTPKVEPVVPVSPPPAASPPPAPLTPKLTRSQHKERLAKQKEKEDEEHRRKLKLEEEEKQIEEEVLHHNEDSSHHDDHKLTREERKMEAILKAFEKLEKREERRKEALLRMDKRKVKDESNSGGKQEPTTVSSGPSQAGQMDDEPEPLVKKEPPPPPVKKEELPKAKGKGKKKRATTPARRRSRFNSGASGYSSAADLMSDPDDSSSQTPLTPVSAKVFDTNDANQQSSLSSSSVAKAFRFPKTKKHLMNEWLSEKAADLAKPLSIKTETVDGISSDTNSPQEQYVRCLPSPHAGSLSHLRRNSSSNCAQTKAAASMAASHTSNAGHSPAITAVTQHSTPQLDCSLGSAKKRWLRQAMFESNPANTPPPGSMSPIPSGSLSPSPHYNTLNSPGTSPPVDFVTPLKKRRLARESVDMSPYPPTPSTPTVVPPILENERQTTDPETPSVVTSSIWDTTPKTEGFGGGHLVNGYRRVSPLTPGTSSENLFERLGLSPAECQRNTSGSIEKQESMESSMSESLLSPNMRVGIPAHASMPVSPHFNQDGGGNGTPSTCIFKEDPEPCSSQNLELLNTRNVTPVDVKRELSEVDTTNRTDSSAPSLLSTPENSDSEASLGGPNHRSVSPRVSSASSSSKDSNVKVCIDSTGTTQAAYDNSIYPCRNSDDGPGATLSSTQSGDCQLSRVSQSHQHSLPSHLLSSPYTDNKEAEACRTIEPSCSDLSSARVSDGCIGDSLPTSTQASNILSSTVPAGWLAAGAVSSQTVASSESTNSVAPEVSCVSSAMPPTLQSGVHNVNSLIDDVNKPTTSNQSPSCSSTGTWSAKQFAPNKRWLHEQSNEAEQRQVSQVERSPTPQRTEDHQVARESDQPASSNNTEALPSTLERSCMFAPSKRWLQEQYFSNEVKEIENSVESGEIKTPLVEQQSAEAIPSVAVEQNQPSCSVQIADESPHSEQVQANNMPSSSQSEKNADVCVDNDEDNDEAEAESTGVTAGESKAPVPMAVDDEENMQGNQPDTSIATVPLVPSLVKTSRNNLSSHGGPDTSLSTCSVTPSKPDTSRASSDNIDATDTCRANETSHEPEQNRTEAGESTGSADTSRETSMKIADICQDRTVESPSQPDTSRSSAMDTTSDAPDTSRTVSIVNSALVEQSQTESEDHFGQADTSRPSEGNAVRSESPARPDTSKEIQTGHPEQAGSSGLSSTERPCQADTSQVSVTEGPCQADTSRRSGAESPYHVDTSHLSGTESPCRADTSRASGFESPNHVDTSRTLITDSPCRADTSENICDDESGQADTSRRPGMGSPMHVDTCRPNSSDNSGPSTSRAVGSESPGCADTSRVGNTDSLDSSDESENGSDPERPCHADTSQRGGRSSPDRTSTVASTESSTQADTSEVVLETGGAADTSRTINEGALPDSELCQAADSQGNNDEDAAVAQDLVESSTSGEQSRRRSSPSEQAVSCSSDTPYGNRSHSSDVGSSQKEGDNYISGSTQQQSAEESGEGSSSTHSIPHGHGQQGEAEQSSVSEGDGQIVDDSLEEGEIRGDDQPASSGQKEEEENMDTSEVSCNEPMAAVNNQEQHRGPRTPPMPPPPDDDLEEGPSTSSNNMDNNSSEADSTCTSSASGADKISSSQAPSICNSTVSESATSNHPEESLVESSSATVNINMSEERNISTDGPTCSSSDTRETRRGILIRPRPSSIFNETAEDNEVSSSPFLSGREHPLLANRLDSLHIESYRTRSSSLGGLGDGIASSSDIVPGRERSSSVSTTSPNLSTSSSTVNSSSTTPLTPPACKKKVSLLEYRKRMKQKTPAPPQPHLPVTTSNSSSATAAAAFLVSSASVHGTGSVTSRHPSLSPLSSSSHHHPSSSAWISTRSRSSSLSNSPKTPTMPASSLSAALNKFNRDESHHKFAAADSIKFGADPHHKLRSDTHKFGADHHKMSSDSHKSSADSHYHGRDHNREHRVHSHSRGPPVSPLPSKKDKKDDHDVRWERPTPSSSHLEPRSIPKAPPAPPPPPPKERGPPLSLTERLRKEFGLDTSEPEDEDKSTDWSVGRESSPPPPPPPPPPKREAHVAGMSVRPSMSRVAPANEDDEPPPPPPPPPPQPVNGQAIFPPGPHGIRPPMQQPSLGPRPPASSQPQGQPIPSLLTIQNYTSKPFNNQRPASSSQSYSQYKTRSGRTSRPNPSAASPYQQPPYTAGNYTNTQYPDTQTSAAYNSSQQGFSQQQPQPVYSNTQPTYNSTQPPQQGVYNAVQPGIPTQPPATYSGTQYNNAQPLPYNNTYNNVQQPVAGPYNSAPPQQGGYSTSQPAYQPQGINYNAPQPSQPPPAPTQPYTNYNSHGYPPPPPPPKNQHNYRHNQ